MEKSPLTTCFYAPPDSRRGNVITLDAEETRHAVKALRLRPGDPLVIVDGAGGWFDARLVSADKQGARCEVLGSRRGVGEPLRSVTIGIGMLKQPNRFEWFLEKAAELGVTHITPLVTERSERESFKRTRAEHILVAAMKQCLRSRLIHLGEPTPFAAFVAGGVARRRFICHEREEQTAPFAKLLQDVPASEPITILIGPEGGFSDTEVAGAVDAGFVPVSLGSRRLRAETAAIAAAAAVALFSSEDSL